VIILATLRCVQIRAVFRAARAAPNHGMGMGKGMGMGMGMGMISPPNSSSPVRNEPLGLSNLTHIITQRAAAANKYVFPIIWFLRLILTLEIHSINLSPGQSLPSPSHPLALVNLGARKT